MKKREEREQEQKKISNSVDVLLGKWRDGTFSEILDDWRWIWKYSAKYKRAIAFYIVMGILSTTLALAGSVAGKYLIDIITGFQTDKLAVLVVILLGSALLSLLFDNVTKRISAKMSISIHNDIQADIFDKIMDANWLEMSRFSNGDILNRFNGDVQTVSSNAISWIPTVVISVYKFVATLVVLLYYDWVMALIALGSAPFVFFLSRYLLKKQREYSQKVREMSSELMTFEAETFYNYDTIKSYGMTEERGKKMRWWQGRYKDVTLKYNLFSIKTHVLLSLLGYVVQFLAFFYCLFRLWTGDITYGTMTLFLQQRASVSDAFNQMLSVAPAFLNSSVSARRIREITELPKEVRIELPAQVREATGLSCKVRMNDVAFGYGADAVVSDVTFETNPGEIVALVGPSGEGKTTMIRLMLGLVRPQQGDAQVEVIIGSEATDDMENDNVICQVPLNVETRSLFAYVPQGNTMINGTVAENLRMVKEDASEKEMEEALKIACAWEFVQKMPLGLASSVGERGRGLSEGQAQRIAIARAILRDAPVLLLDEATSALDVDTERQVLKNIVTHRPNKTCIVTTHRPSVLGMCQRVYMVKAGSVNKWDRDEVSPGMME